MPTPEEILEEARRLIGTETKPQKARYPVEYEPLRRWCHMANNSNSLFLDPEYAKKTKYGEVICPPGAIQLFTRRQLLAPQEPGAWIPDPEEEQLPDVPVPEGMNIPFNMGNEWEFLKPVKVGERLSYKRRLADVYIKGMRYDPQTFWTTTEQIFMNEAGEEVAIFRSFGLRYRSAEQLRKVGITDYPR